jgi:hypothetical protein
MPDFVLGGVGPGAFNATLGSGGGAPPVFPIMPGLPLHAVPQFIGANHWQYLPLQFNMQPDPTRPWLYVGNNPSQPFVQSTRVQVVLDGLFDPVGNPVPSLPLVVDFVQGPIHRTFQVNATGFPGNVQVPLVDLGPILAQPYQLTVGVQDLGGGLVATSALSAGASSPSATESAPGYVSLDAITVTLGGFSTTAVSTPPRTASALELAAPSPNPCRTATRIGFTLPGADHVRVAIFDMQGRQVRSLADAAMAAGGHSLIWDGRDGAQQPLSVGLYLARVETSSASEARKITLVR